MSRTLRLWLGVSFFLSVLIGCLPEDGVLNPRPDCNGNGIADRKDIRSGTSADCNRNRVPDECDIADGTSLDCNSDGIPDECQPDADGDGVIDACDGCPEDPQKTDPGACGCGVPDTDADHNGTPDCLDPSQKPAPDCNANGVPDKDDITAGTSHDCNADGVPDECQSDADGDGLIDPCDGCPGDASKTEAGLCGCGVLEVDSDGDGTLDCGDGCPNDPDKIHPGTCGCGAPDVDSDGDGILDCQDPGDPPGPDCNANGVPDVDDIAAGTSTDCNGDGVPDECQMDTDGDGLINPCDGCPNDPAKMAPGACGCGVPDADSDGDGTPDCGDACPSDPAKIEPGVCGCGVSDVDSDGDGIPDCGDGCPSDPAKNQPGLCGCGVSDADSDSDGVPDCEDGCPNDPAKMLPGQCGCGVPEMDSDGDGVPDCLDGCPNDPTKLNPGACGCGTPDTDSDHDGVPNCLDGCPHDPAKVSPGACGCGVPDTDANGNGTPDCLDPPECEITYFTTDAAAAEGFTGCFTGEGRIGNAAWPWPCTHELDLSVNTAAPTNTHNFCWHSGHTYLFSLVWDGTQATFTVGGVVMQDTFTCQQINALQLRCRAKDGRIDLTNLVLNGQPLEEQVGAYVCGHRLKIMRVVCGIDGPFTLTGTARMQWRCFEFPTQSNLAFQITAGQMEGAQPPVDCNHNGIPDDQDIASGTSADCDGNAVPDECQTDTDGDGVIDPCDGCPNDPSKTEPGVCGCGAPDTDTDGDGTPDCNDGCPSDPSKTQPGACGCGVPDTDTDGDGTPDCNDGCPNDPGKTEPGVCGCGVPDTDTDGDGTPDCNDGCPDDPGKTEPGVCGCGVPDTDTDGDGTPDCNDGCPDDPDKIEPGVCGCGVPDTDTDGDGTPDCNDGCPDDPDKTQPGVCGCGVPDTDTDGDGTPDCNDGCPDDPAKTEPGVCGCGVPDTDSDSDGVPDCLDLCPDTPAGLPVDEFGCPPLVADAGADVTLDEVGPVTLQGSASGGLPPYSYSWSAPGWGGSTEQNPIVMPSQTAVYTLTVTDSSSPPKVSADTVTVTINTHPGLRYTIAAVGTLSPNGTYPQGINDGGDVVGCYYTAAWKQRAFLYSGGVMTDLGTLGGTTACAYDINNVGQVAGASTNAAGRQRAFLWQAASGMQSLGTFTGGTMSVAYALNESAQVVGYGDISAAYHAFLYSSGVMNHLGTLGYYQSGAFDINDHSQVVGILMDGVGHATAFLYADGTLYDLGAPLLSDCQAWVINNLGLVAGTAWGPGEDRSFLCADGVVIDLGTLPGFPKTYATGINDPGQVVGTLTNATGTLSHAFIYTGGELRDLNDLLVPGHEWEHLAAAYDINNAGQITGYGRLNGQDRGFILTPVP